MKSIHSRLEEPNQFTQIHLIQQIGQGGFGVVYLADVEQVNGFRQRVAIKVLNREATEHPELLARQRDEARLLGLLNHENIVRVFDFCEVNGQSVIIMEYVSGLSISNLMKVQPIPLSVVLQIMTDCARALDYAYTTFHPQLDRPLRAIHRDIKPSNVILSQNGQVKLLDFGISRADMERDAPTSSFQMGTERYMAPEQWLENRSGPEVDVYALGLMGLEMLSGRTLPRLPLDNTVHRVQVESRIQNLLMEAPPIIQDLVRTLFWEMLQFKMENRPSAEDVYERFSALVDEVGGESVRQYASKHSCPKETQSSSSDEVNILANENVFLAGTTLSIVPQIDSIVDVKNYRPSLLFLMFFSIIGILVWSLLLTEETVGDSTDQIKEIEPIRDLSVTPPKLPKVISVEPTKKTTLKPSKKELLELKTSIMEAPLYNVTISSIPLGAKVFVDGNYIGTTLLHQTSIAQGEHTIRMIWKEHSIENVVNVQDKARYVWSVNKIGEESWSSY